MINDNAHVIGVLSSGAYALSALNVHLQMFVDTLRPKYTSFFFFFFMLAYAHSRTRSLANYISFVIW